MSAILFAGLLAVVFPGENAAWSPKGDEVVLEVDVGGDQPRLAVFDAITASEKFRLCEDGACHASWRPDGEAVVFTRRYRRAETGRETLAADDGWNLCVWERGKGCRRLTNGRYHDAMPSFSADGRSVCFVSTRESPSESKTSVFRVAADGRGAIERIGNMPTADIAWTGQPVESPDGRFLVWAQMDHWVDVWHLRLAKVSDPDDNVIVTEPLESAYEPRFSPDGRYLAYTGYRLGDDGWGVYLQDFKTGGTCRVAKGRSCGFRHDGKALLVTRDGKTEEKVLSASDWPTAADVKRRNRPSETILWRGENLSGPVSIPFDERFAFENDEVVFARARFRIPPLDNAIHAVFRGSYGNTINAFVLFVGRNCVELSQHDEADHYLYVRAPRPEAGKVVELVGVRSPEASLLYVDGHQVASIVSSRGMFPLLRPKAFVAAPDFGPGEVEKLEFGRGWPRGIPLPRTRQEVLK